MQIVFLLFKKGGETKMSSVTRTRRKQGEERRSDPRRFRNPVRDLRIYSLGACLIGRISEDLFHIFDHRILGRTPLAKSPIETRPEVQDLAQKIVDDTHFSHLVSSSSSSWP